MSLSSLCSLLAAFGASGILLRLSGYPKNVGICCTPLQLVESWYIGWRIRLHVRGFIGNNEMSTSEMRACHLAFILGYSVLKLE